MQYEELISSLQQIGKDPSRLIFEDELTGLSNRRFLLNYFEQKVQWDALESSPLSLLMMDLDYFKRINDTHGHHSGDQALTFLARLLKEVAGEQGIPIRYGGDEFMILVPGGPKPAAMDMGKQLRERIHAQPLHLEDRKVDLHLTLSIGVATAPEDAQSGKVLIQKADTALYHAKKSGRDRVANATEIALKEVSVKAALQLLDARHVSSRGEYLAQVSEVLKQFDAGASQVVLVEGASGMGKTTFLEAIRTNLMAGEGYVVRVNGVKQESYRPYYLITNILVNLLNQKEDKGAAAFQSLNTKETAYLAKVLPQLQGPVELRIAEDEVIKRQGIFNTITKFVYQVLDSQPLVVLIDDIQLADEATLMVLRRLILRRGVPIFICGTCTELKPVAEEEQATPIERFYADQKLDLAIMKITLAPLTASDIETFLKTLFPQLSAPPNFEQTLAEATKGNPLFLSEILRKLVLDQKLLLVGQQWTIEPLEDGYLPQSLDDIVNQKISTLDEDSQRLLAQASTFGEDVSLSYLAGSSDTVESKVLEFIDQAAALGLLSSDFQLNDETIRFVGKKVLEIAYSGIREDRRQELHERVGAYQEQLYKKRMIPSPSTVAYHFKRSANKEKAKIYEDLKVSQETKLFNPQEALSYKVEAPGEGGSDTPLDPGSLSYVPTVIRALLTAVRNIKLYSSESRAAANANLELAHALNKVLAGNQRLSIVRVKQALLVNGQRITDVSEYKFVMAGFLEFLDKCQLQGLAFSQGLSDQELKATLEGFAHARPEQISVGYWDEFVAQRSLSHVHLRQARSFRRALATSAFATATAPETAPAEVEAAGLHFSRTTQEPTELRLPEATPVPTVAEAEPPEAAVAPDLVEKAPEQTVDELIATLPQRVNDLLLTGSSARIQRILSRLFDGFAGQEQSVRDKVIEVCRTTLKGLPLGFQQEFSKLLADPMLGAFGEELDAKSFSELAGLIHQVGCSVIQFADYLLASRLLTALTARFKQLGQAKDPKMPVLAKVLERKLDPGTQRLLTEDLKSSDPTRQQNAAQVLGSLGAVTVPILIEAIRKEPDMRVRQIAAGLLREIGVPSAKAYKRELGLELPATERVRLLEVGDTVTKAIKTEVAYAMGDSHAEVRGAAAHLAERLNDKQLTQVLLQYAEHDDAAIAVDAIKCLGNLKPPGLGEALIPVLNSAKEPERLAACCQALGQIGDIEAIGTLAGVLSPNGFLFFRKRWHPDVRAAAALALGQMTDPLATQVLTAVVNDRDPRVRQIARTAVKK